MNQRLERLLHRQHTARPLSSYVARKLVPRSILFAAMASALMVGNAMSVDPLAAPADSTPSAVPTWSIADADANPGCVPSQEWPEGQPADAVVGYSFRDQQAQRIGFDAAWEQNHNDSESDDVWVVGVCP